ncbi:MAG: hypothetical protein LBJ11_03815 [Oscillospiraceae bacterium]|jgi:carbamoyltransferase|nr:hypothetical protein [Oscillospiraceae bacterium]
MQISLGIHVGHDRGACIIKDQKVVGATAQERLDRKKYSTSPSLPYVAIDKLLHFCNIGMSDVSCIGLSYDGIEGTSFLDLYQREFFAHYNCEYIPFYAVCHHDAHAYSAFFSSGFSDSLVFVADGGGDYIGGMQEAESLYFGKNGRVQCVEKRLQNPPVRRIGDRVNYILPNMPFVIRNAEISLGRKYEQVTHLLNFGWGEAGKTMGIASYGNPYVDFKPPECRGLDFSLKYADLLGQVFSKFFFSGKSFAEFIEEENKNIAATAQHLVEETIVSLINGFFEKYPCRNLCLAGGLFLNCLTNQKVVDKCFPEKIFIFPAAGDDGQAIGCAYYAYSYHFGQKGAFEIQLPYLGIDYPECEIRKVLDEKNLTYEVHDDNALAALVAEYISQDKIVALHRGRTEIGPRALCHRSILANPTNPDMKDILNHRVKHRESFRPFAPTVTQEDQYTYFDLQCSSDYMLFAAKVKPAYQQALPAITHVDGTARVQAISKRSDAFIHCVLEGLKQRTGFPIVLNTSFNVAGQPIVESPMDAVQTFLVTDIDILVIGNCLVAK